LNRAITPVAPPILPSTELVAMAQRSNTYKILKAKCNETVAIQEKRLANREKVLNNIFTK
jgi:hypothetical protein